MARARTERALATTRSQAIGASTMERIERIDDASSRTGAGRSRSSADRPRGDAARVPMYALCSDAPRCECRILRHPIRPVTDAAER